VVTLVRDAVQDWLTMTWAGLWGSWPELDAIAHRVAWSATD